MSERDLASSKLCSCCDCLLSLFLLEFVCVVLRFRHQFRFRFWLSDNNNNRHHHYHTNKQTSEQCLLEFGLSNHHHFRPSYLLESDGREQFDNNRADTLTCSAQKIELICLAYLAVSCKSSASSIRFMS